MTIGRNRRPRHALAACATTIAFSAAHAADNPAEVFELPRIEVIGTTPLPGLGTPIRDVPANVQVYTSKEIGRQRQGNLGEFLEQNPTSVSINSSQGNPFQPDVNYRGFTASPLLGTPQGLSVFQDGVRINEPFGDVVNWDLLPQSAISSIQLIPGSIPAFGLNTLGGALAVYTKSGSQYPGGALELSGGSFGRKTLQLEQGGKFGDWDYFVTGNDARDRGWADHNASHVRQFFGKVGYQTEKTDLDLSLTSVNNILEGTQTLPSSFLDDIRQAYTFPDRARNTLAFVALKGSHFLTDDLLLSGNAYHRNYRNRSVSSNVNRDFGSVDPTTGAVDDIQATNDQSQIDQTNQGYGLQLTYSGAIGTHKNQFTIGGSSDFGRARFTQDTQPAQFTAARDTVGIGDFTRDTDADTRNRYDGLFAADTFALDPRWTLTVSGRYNRAVVSIEDRSGNAPLLDGTHRYARFNKAIGINFNPDARLTTYVSYNEGMRAPTPIELTCADPDAPCKLPNNFLADPDLREVRSRTVETGARGQWNESSSWSAAIYRTELSNDIQFVSSGAGFSNAGYFQNVGKTRRQGIELTAKEKFGKLAVTARYSYLQATFQSGFIENSASNSSADATGAIQVERGNRIPGLPQHVLKLRLDYAWNDAWSIGSSVNTTSSIYARGDENNRDVHGKISGFTVVNIDARYQIGKDLELFARVNNLFDRRYANFGVVGANFFTGPNRTFGPAAGVDPATEQFRSPGVPRGAWLGLRYRWS